MFHPGLFVLLTFILRDPLGHAATITINQTTLMKRIIILILIGSLMCIMSTGANRQASKTKANHPKVAIALGGGGAKGAAAIGALKYIEKAGIPVDYVVGTSAGAIIGSLYSVGYNANEIDTLFRSQDWKHMFTDVAPLRNRLGKLKNFIPGILSGKHFTEKMDSLLQHRDCDFDSLPIPFRAIAVDMVEFKEVCIDHGNLADAVRASMSVPLAFRPIEKDSMTLVDGGLLNNLPVDVAFQLGADIVIAIDLMDAKRAEQEGRDSIRSSGLGALIAWEFARPDLKKYHQNREAATLLIHPDVSGYKGTSFAPEETDQLIRNGEEAGQAVWEQLQVIANLCNVKRKAKK